MSQFELKIDPKAKDKAAIQKLIDDLNSHPGSRDYLNIPTLSRSGPILLTDNPESVTTDNQRLISAGPDKAGFAQQSQA